MRERKYPLDENVDLKYQDEFEEVQLKYELI